MARSKNADHEQDRFDRLAKRAEKRKRINDEEDNFRFNPNRPPSIDDDDADESALLKPDNTDSELIHDAIEAGEDEPQDLEPLEHQ